MNIPLLLSSALFISVITFFAGILYFIDVRKRQRQMVDKIIGAGENLILGKDSPLGQEGPKGSFVNFISSLGNRIMPKGEAEVSGMRIRLLQAGYRRHDATLFYFGYKVFFAVVFSSLFIIGKVIFVKAVPPGYFMTLAVMLAMAGFYLPNIWLMIKTSSRQREILDGFPDALDLMVVCVEAGMGLDGAINRVGEEMKLRNEVLSGEFRLLSLELRAGKLRRDALRNLGIRTGLEDIKSLMTLLIQTDKFGTSIAQALRVHSDSMRSKRYQRAEEMAAKLPVKLVFPLILCIFPALFVVIIGPAVIRIFRVLFPAMGGP